MDFDDRAVQTRRRDHDAHEPLLLNHVHQPADNPYRASDAIFVREGAVEAYDAADRVPAAIPA